MSGAGRRTGLGTVTIVVALKGVAACGNAFTGDDCPDTRTCEAAAGSSGAEGGSDAGAGDTPENGEAGAVSMPGDDCKSFDECDDGDSANGQELCSELGACEAGNPPPRVLSVSPEHEATEIDPDEKITITFSEALDPASVTAQSVQVLDGDVPIAGALSYLDRKVTFTPTVPLALVASYRLSISTGVTDADGAALLEPFESTFSVRDGAWTTIDAGATGVPRVVGMLPVTAFGDVLLTWNSPASARFFRRGAATDEVSVLAGASGSVLGAAGNADGVLGVLLQVSGDTHIGQYRDGAWITPGLQVMSAYDGLVHARVVVAPDGSITLFEDSNPGTVVRRLGPTGANLTAAVLGSDAMLTPPSTAFDSLGNGLALWRAENAAGADRIVYSRYTSSDGKWSQAEMLPNGASEGPSDFGRGAAPAVAMAGNGAAAALWIEQVQWYPSVCVLMASLFSPGEGWANPTPLTASVPLPLPAMDDAPGLVFDGETFVGAVTGGVQAPERFTYSVRYDAVADGWTYEKHQAGVATTSQRMPRLLGDGRGNLILIWAIGATPSFILVYQRYANGQWSETRSLPNGGILDSQFETGLDANPPPPLPASMNAGGLAAVAWSNFIGVHTATNIRLASFF